MKAVLHAKVAAVLLLGIACAVITLAGARRTAIMADTPPAVTVSSTTLASGEQVPVVTVTAKRLSVTEKTLLALRDRTFVRKAGGHA
ncbi:MAG TPA: hypothetical protein VJ577_08635 [Burkholderiaceae bacterium]|nr:hypothetical protein [Burkholderiaceae bacterium]